MPTKEGPSQARRGFSLRPTRLLTRLVLALFALMAAAGACQILVTVYLWNFYNRSSLVELYRSTADEIARELESQLRPNMSATDMARLLYRFSATCPELNPYLLDSQGKVVGSLRSGNFTVSMQPIQRFLSQTGDDSTLVWGDHPVTHLPTLFSVAPLSLPTGPGYVYVLLGSDAASVLRQSLGDTSLAFVSVLFGVVTLLTTSGVGYLVFRQIFRRYNENTATMRKFELGDYSVRLDEGGTTEVASHARAFNRMADKIAETISQLELVDASRRSLVAAVTHDLRRPLTNIHLAVQRIEMRAARSDDAATATLAQEAKRSCDNLDQLIEDLFQLAKLDAGEKLNASTLLVSTVGERLTASLLSVAEQHQITLVNEVPDSLYVAADDEKLMRLLSNLVENAILYSGSGSTVTFRARPSGDRAIIQVADNGRGIAEDELSRLFEWFYRGEHGVKARPSGSGLGLAICKRIAELHGSQLKASSTVGSGTTFEFTLPIAAP